MDVFINMGTPWKINGWNLQITHLERKMIFQTSMIMFHVNLPGCKQPGSLFSLLTSFALENHKNKTSHSHGLAPVPPVYQPCWVCIPTFLVTEISIMFTSPPKFNGKSPWKWFPGDEMIDDLSDIPPKFEWFEWCAYSNWWFQPIWKIVKLDHFPR